MATADTKAPAKRRRESDDWLALLSASIPAGDAATMKRMKSQLEDVGARVQRRLMELQSACGVGVVLENSNQTYAFKEAPTKYDDPCLTRTVEATFTVGPNRTPFSLTFTNEKYGPTVNGAVEATHDTATLFSIEPRLQAYSRLRPKEITSNGPLRASFSMTDLAAFLRKAGVADLQPDGVGADMLKYCDYYDSATRDDDEDAIRHRWLFGEIFRDCIDLINEKSAGDKRKYGVSLGVDRDETYECFGVEFPDRYL